MATKQQNVGICDLCLEQMPRDMWYTRRGPRLYCSIDCRNTANSRAGAPIRGRKAKARVLAGTWENPARLNPPRPENIGRGVRETRQREVSSGTWRNPALTSDARAKLSKPRKHDGALHSAIEKLKQGASVRDLSEADQIAHREYRKQLRDQRKGDLNRQARERYHRQQKSMTNEQREEQRARWRAQNARKTKR